MLNWSGSKHTDVVKRATHLVPRRFSSTVRRARERLSTAFGGPAGADLSQDTVFDLLYSPRRRHVLSYLRERNSSVTFDELTRYVALEENGGDSESDLSTEQRRRVHVSLYQTHLPKLDSAGIITYDKQRGEITLERRASELDAYLDVDADTERSWDRYYLGLAASSAGIVGGGWLGLAPFVGVSTFAWAFVINAAFAVTALGHAVDRFNAPRPRLRDVDE